jgi:hypothetical protein
MRKILLATALMQPVTGCGIEVSGDAMCSGIARAVSDHAAALADDGGDRSVTTGARLIALLDAGCDA